MTAISINRTSQSFPIIPVILFIFIIFIIGMSVYSLSTPITGTEKYVLEEYGEINVEQIRIIEIVSGHAWIGHGTEVNEAFDCLGKNGSTKTFKTFGFVDKKGNKIPTTAFLCMTDNGVWYTIVTTIFEKIGDDKVARLVTGYKVAIDVFPTIEKYIDYLKLNWAAIETNYSISAGTIYLRPK